MLGYFSLVGLLRLHSLLGDYYQAIKVLENIELNKKVSTPVCSALTSKNTDLLGRVARKQTGSSLRSLHRMADNTEV
jgi:hypothetical protein